MTHQKQKMQADGSGTSAAAPDDAGELASRRGGAGESGGGPYPDPHSKAENDESGDFKGGQSNQAYYGQGQLGEKDVGRTHNAPSKQS